MKSCCSAIEWFGFTQAINTRRSTCLMPWRSCCMTSSAPVIEVQGVIRMDHRQQKPPRHPSLRIVCRMPKRCCWRLDFCCPIPPEPEWRRSRASSDALASRCRRLPCCEAWCVNCAGQSVATARNLWFSDRAIWPPVDPVASPQAGVARCDCCSDSF